MELTKFGHSCVRLSEAGRTVVIDPGAFSEPADALAGADAVLITHEHADHLAVDAVRAALQADQHLKLFAPSSVTTSFDEFGDRVVVAAAGETYDVAGFDVRGVGGQHALIHPLIPLVANVGYVVNGEVYHPGDSFIVAPVSVKTVLVPVHAPWSKLSEVIDFVVASRADQAYQIHDGLLNDLGHGVIRTQVTNIGGQYGDAFRYLDLGETVAV